MSAFILIAANLIAAALLLRYGAAVERWCVLLVAAYMAANPIAELWHFGDWRAGTAVLELLLFAGFWFLAERGRRWWLVAAAGSQLVVALTHIIPLIAPDYFLWTQVTVRLIVWIVISLTFFAGVLEASADRRFAQEGEPDDTSYPASGLQGLGRS